MRLRLLFCLLLAGCAGFSQTATPVRVDLPDVLRQAQDNKSKGSLLYIGDWSLVRVYSYPRGKLAGTLIQNYNVNGMCANPVTGDVFFVESVDVVEYAHGGLSPINTLKFPDMSAWSCAVDPRSGDLAVTDIVNPQVVVYPHGSGTPKTYANLPGFRESFECVYDNRGNLYVTGQSTSLVFELDEIPKRGVPFTVSLASTALFSPRASAGVQWDGRYVLLSDGGDNVYQVKIKRNTGTPAGRVVLEEARGVDQMWLEGNELVAPNEAQEVVQFFKYPAGGNPIKTITGFVFPRGAAVSVAPK